MTCTSHKVYLEDSVVPIGSIFLHRSTLSSDCLKLISLHLQADSLMWGRSLVTEGCEIFPCFSTVPLIRGSRAVEITSKWLVAYSSLRRFSSNFTEEAVLTTDRHKTPRRWVIPAYSNILLSRRNAQGGEKTSLHDEMHFAVVHARTCRMRCARCRGR